MFGTLVALRTIRPRDDNSSLIATSYTSVHTHVDQTTIFPLSAFTHSSMTQRYHIINWH